MKSVGRLTPVGAEPCYPDRVERLEERVVEPQENVGRCNIMVVDDTPANLEVLSGMLRRQGYRVRPVPSGRLALKSARVEPPHLMLLDVNMPDMNGYELCRCMRQEDELKDIPIIFVSAMDDTADKLRAFEAGGVDYVTKPFQFEEIDARVRAHLELRSKRQALEDANHRLHELERQRDQLTHMIVHDMRTPLTGLCGFLEILQMLEGDSLSEQGANSLRLSQASAERLVDMVTAVLDVSRLENRSSQVSVTPFDLETLVRRVVSNYRPEQRCSFEVACDAPSSWIAADAALLGRAIRALLANACQASAEDATVRVTLRMLDGEVELSVEDEGAPIPPDVCEVLFRRDALTPANREHRKYVSGLGLALCRLVADAHRGSVGVTCGVDRGRRFWLRLPRAPVVDDSGHDG